MAIALLGCVSAVQSIFELMVTVFPLCRDHRRQMNRWVSSRTLRWYSVGLNLRVLTQNSTGSGGVRFSLRLSSVELVCWICFCRFFSSFLAEFLHFLL